MRFEFYSEALENIPKLSVDGTVSNSIHFSHWEGNNTPVEVKADTSTEIALNLVTSPNRAMLTDNIELVTNNHFDTDGVLSVWTVLTGERASEFREVLISAAEAGDFSECTTRDGVRISIAIQGPDQASSNNDTASPLACFIAKDNVADEARAYELVLPEVERLLTHIDDYEPLWRDGWARVADALESFEKCTSNVIEYSDSGLSLVTLSPELFDGTGFNPAIHSAPYTAISKFAQGELYLICVPSSGGWFYRLDYPYYSWAETVVRPRIERRDLGTVLQALNEMEIDGQGHWREDNREMTSAIKFLDNQGTLAPSMLKPDEVVGVLQKSAARAQVA